jgi:phosphate transport system substrate-binding protein
MFDRPRINPIVVMAAAVALAASCAAARADGIELKETGSTLILPLFKTWADAYAKTHPGITITTDGSGSTKGIGAAIDGSAQIGTSDAFMSSQEAAAHPDILNVALAISAQTINYNLPDLKQPLRLDGPTLANIYTGKIRSWDDAAIAALNPGVNLPHHDIVTVRRADGSGDTFIFTQYLSFTTSAPETIGFLAAPPSWATGPGFGTSIDWPQVPGGQAATGNDGIVDTLQKTPYSIGYVGISFQDRVKQAGLGTAMMKSYSGQFLLPTEPTITAAAASLTPRTPDDERITLVNAPGDNCYPLINYEYAMVSATQSNPTTAVALRNFLLWAVAPDEENARTLADQHFIPLPAHIWVKSHDQIEKIGKHSSPS